MATVCRGCATKFMPPTALPPVRVMKAPCELCGNATEAGGRNYNIPNMQLPSHPTNADVQAEREENDGGS